MTLAVAHDDLDQLFGLDETGTSTQPAISASSSSSRLSSSSSPLLSPESLSSLLQPVAYYNLSTARDNDQLITRGQTRVASLAGSSSSSSSSVSVVGLVEGADYVKVPDFALLDEGQHGPHVSDHSSHKLHYDGYWEQKMKKLQQQKPIADVYQNTQLWKKKTQTEQNSKQQQSKPETTTHKEGIQHKRQREDEAAQQAQEAEDDTREGKRMKHTTSSSSASSASSSISMSPSVLPLSIFNGCVFYINGRTEGSGELSVHALTAVIRLHGGDCLPVISRTTLTHLIAGNLTLSKNHQEWLRQYGPGKRQARGGARAVECVRPDWVRDCIQAGRRLSEVPYRIIQDCTQRKITFHTAAGASNSNSNTSQIHQAEPYTADVEIIER